MLCLQLFPKSQFSTGHIIVLVLVGWRWAGGRVFLLIGVNKYLLNIDSMQGSDLLFGDTKVHGHF